MHVVATAGHVDHGKSTLVRALTGSDPDRLAEEHRRGLSIELGFCWTSLPGAGQVAFVDVPGHERFVPTMLAGIGPVPAVLFVVAADDPWMPQAEEHLHALDELGVGHGVLAVTRSDLAPPGPVLERARDRLARTSLREAPAVAVSGRTGDGMAELRRLLAEMVTKAPAPDPDADVRLWLDRRFHVRGAGTVVTGTLPAGRIRTGDLLFTGSRPVRIRSVQSLGASVDAVQGVARVALNVAGDGVRDLHRGSALVTPQAWQLTDLVDVRVDTERLVERPVLHVGAAAVGTRARPLGAGSVRLRLDRPLPLRAGDRALLRDPGSRSTRGVTVLDPAPPPLGRRGAARARADALAAHPGVPEPGEEVRRRGLVRLDLLRRLGVDTSQLRTGVDGVGVLAGDWVVSQERAEDLRRRLEALVREHDQEHPLHPGVPLAAAAQALDLPNVDVVAALARELMGLSAGRVVARDGVGLPEEVETALAELERDLDARPFDAPTADRLRSLGLGAPAVAAASRAGRLLRLDAGVVLLPGAVDAAVAWLSELDAPFTVSQARERLGTSRRVAVPLLAYLDKRGLTRRLADDRRLLRTASQMAEEPGR